jgi:hypothetical protein
MIDFPVDANILRRHFASIATKDYDDPACTTLPEVVAEVETLREWLCDERLSDRQFHSLAKPIPLNPAETDIYNALRTPVKPWGSADAAVLFITGHGTIRDGSHWVILKTTDTARPYSTAIRTGDIIGWLRETAIQHLLVIIDLCYAGATISDTVRFDADFPSTWLVLASVTKNQEATTGVLTNAIREFLAELSTPEGEKFSHGPYLLIEHFLEAVQSRLGASQQISLLLPGILGVGPSPCLPNPLYKPGTSEHVQLRRRDLALREEDLLAHWGPKARGVGGADDPGWLFAGRVRLMHRLIAFTISAPQTVLVTGSAGCGKSAALARLVTLSDPGFLAAYQRQVDQIPADLKPAMGSVDVAVLATGKLPQEVFSQVCDALGVPFSAGGTRAPTLNEMRRSWWDWLRLQPGPITIVIDALDEAAYPYSLLTDVLTKLEPPDSGERRVRLLVGVRSPGGEDTFTANGALGGQALADTAENELGAIRLRVDEAPLWETGDLADYVADLLLNTEGSPYVPLGIDGARPVAEAVAARSGKSFLVGRLAATSLVHRVTAVSSADSSWLSLLDDGVVSVFRGDLHMAIATPSDRERAVHLMRAVAFAYGRGIPWSKVWPLITNAVANDPERTYGDSDISWLLSSRLGGYLITDREDGITVYRLFHDALRATLRDRWDDLLKGSQ